MPQTVTVQGRRITLDLLLWRAYGRAGNTAAMLAAALKLNPGLAGQGPEIPLRTRVTLPDPPRATTRAPRKVVSLFD
ncbi:tail protein X [Methylobacterium sp. WSM2598]|uniref:tail protein X n=1 Tax=Methylobacterium sp. WSM2598 TaxID=398261 RepID=UPI00035E9151|nr:tail protein X [Methylobacterium sp. WSM2598]